MESTCSDPNSDARCAACFYGFIVNFLDKGTHRSQSSGGELTYNPMKQPSAVAGVVALVGDTSIRAINAKDPSQTYNAGFRFCFSRRTKPSQQHAMHFSYGNNAL